MKENLLNNENVNAYEEKGNLNNDERDEHMISLRGLNIYYKDKLESLNTIKNIDNNKKFIKLVLEDVDLKPEEIMKQVLHLLKEKTSLHTILEINKQKYKIKYKEIIPDDHILFTQNIQNITNCKYAFLGILKVSKYTKKNTFNEKLLQSWQDEPMDF
ncbi:hypothetical protein PGSY75_1317700 [Plasmodium gaboni]|uniref:Uncharacterized protein n=1 Tax=Plasmodium gaboni TaxID=647221 RepID=A0A151LDF2_9APIC|nr:hypothetical protein PGSY75_1317700 [Plasmodium gaboni]KYN96978.1 hypothetical protein PGSY75_1317700 [Plasmodium gaboni]